MPTNEQIDRYRSSSDGTGWFVGTVVGLALLAIFYLVFSANSQPSAAYTAPDRPVASAFVKVTDAMGGHGSGVHLGDGLILTAAHVVGIHKTAEILTDVGDKQVAEVLWVSADYDLALVRVATDDQIKSASLDCSTNPIGQRVRAYGNPLDVEFIYTSGIVAGKARSYGPWKSIVPTDIAVAPGQSGGAVVSESTGRVVGITVGVMVVPYFGVAAIGYFVPASVACDLLDKN